MKGGGYQIASSLVLLAMTEGGHCGRSPRVIVSPSSPVIASEAWQSQESKTQKSKGKMTEQKMKKKSV
jgi:hypothetical protein